MSNDLQILKAEMRRRNLGGSYHDPEVANAILNDLYRIGSDGCGTCDEGCEPRCQTCKNGNSE